jgi:hypothetical protein
MELLAQKKYSNEKVPNFDYCLSCDPSTCKTGCVYTVSDLWDIYFKAKRWGNGNSRKAIDETVKFLDLLADKQLNKK